MTSLERWMDTQLYRKGIELKVRTENCGSRGGMAAAGLGWGTGECSGGYAGVLMGALEAEDE